MRNLFKVINLVKAVKVVQIVNTVVLVSLLLTLNSFHTLFLFSIVDFEQVNVGWDKHILAQSKFHAFLHYLYIIGMFSVGDTSRMSCFVGFGYWNNTSSS